MQELSPAFDLVPILKLIITIFAMLKLSELMFPSFFKASRVLTEEPEESKHAKMHEAQKCQEEEGSSFDRRPVGDDTRRNIVLGV